jgi:hypothetical protein
MTSGWAGEGGERGLGKACGIVDIRARDADFTTPPPPGLQRAHGIRQSGVFLENFLDPRCILTGY